MKKLLILLVLSNVLFSYTFILKKENNNINKIDQIEKEIKKEEQIKKEIEKKRKEKEKTFLERIKKDKELLEEKTTKNYLYIINTFKDTYPKEYFNYQKTIKNIINEKKLKNEIYMNIQIILKNYKYYSSKLKEEPYINKKAYKKLKNLPNFYKFVFLKKDIELYGATLKKMLFSPHHYIMFQKKYSNKIEDFYANELINIYKNPKYRKFIENITGKYEKNSKYFLEQQKKDLLIKIKILILFNKNLYKHKKISYTQYIDNNYFFKNLFFYIKSLNSKKELITKSKYIERILYLYKNNYFDFNTFFIKYYKLFKNLKNFKINV